MFRRYAMNAAEIRIQILTQHAELRTLIEETRAATARVPRGQPEGHSGPVACVGRLASALREHNRCEEQLLRGVLVTVDAWGPARAELMDERHTAEHTELHAALVDAPFNPKRVGHVLDRL